VQIAIDIVIRITYKAKGAHGESLEHNVTPIYFAMGSDFDLIHNGVICQYKDSPSFLWLTINVNVIDKTFLEAYGIQ
jgi:glucosamine 6-phosphate synthetase-like amidotransferase/phosphosugar isomerase protein